MPVILKTTTPTQPRGRERERERERKKEREHEEENAIQKQQSIATSSAVFFLSPGHVSFVIFSLRVRKRDFWPNVACRWWLQSKYKYVCT